MPTYYFKHATALSPPPDMMQFPTACPTPSCPPLPALLSLLPHPSTQYSGPLTYPPPPHQPVAPSPYSSLPHWFWVCFWLIGTVGTERSRDDSGPLLEWHWFQDGWCGYPHPTTSSASPSSPTFLLLPCAPACLLYRAATLRFLHLPTLHLRACCLLYALHSSFCFCTHFCCIAYTIPLHILLPLPYPLIGSLRIPSPRLLFTF